MAARIALVLAAALLVAGCGGSSRKSAENEIRASVLAFLHSYARGDAPKSCSLLTTRGRRELLGQSSESSCEKIVRKQTSRQGPAATRTRNQLLAARIVLVTFKSDTTARVSVQLPTENAPTAPFRVVKRGERWLVDGPARSV